MVDDAIRDGRNNGDRTWRVVAIEHKYTQVGLPTLIIIVLFCASPTARYFSISCIIIILEGRDNNL